MNLFWPSAGVVAIAAIVIFKAEIGAAIGRIQAVGPTGVTMVDQININVSSPPSAAKLQELRDQIAKQAKEVLGMHPVSLSYLIRSATCSLWNTKEIQKIEHIKYLKELNDIEMASVFTVKNVDTETKFGGDGAQLIFKDKGKFLLMAFEVDPQDCKPAEGAKPFEFISSPPPSSPVQ